MFSSGARNDRKCLFITLLFALAMIVTACRPVQVEHVSHSVRISEDVTVEMKMENSAETHQSISHAVVGKMGEDIFSRPDRTFQEGDFILFLPIVLKGEEEEVEDAEVTILDSVFQPAQITIPAGTTVVWTQNSFLPHTVTADDGSFNSGTMGNGDTFSHTFNEPGTYPYYCAFHGAPGGIGMAGVIIVESP
jgi:plastocyanin